MGVLGRLDMVSNDLHGLLLLWTMCRVYQYSQFATLAIAFLCLVYGYFQTRLQWTCDRHCVWSDTILMCAKLPFDLVEYLVQFIIWEKCGHQKGHKFSISRPLNHLQLCVVEQSFMLQALNDLPRLEYDEEGGDNDQYFVGCHMGFGCKICA